MQKYIKICYVHHPQLLPFPTPKKTQKFVIFLKSHLLFHFLVLQFDYSY
jgi:hypothetical protein